MPMTNSPHVSFVNPRETTVDTDLAYYRLLLDRLDLREGTWVYEPVFEMLRWLPVILRIISYRIRFTLHGQIT
jgi:hypothetical protein